MRGIGANVAHVLTNNVRRRRGRLVGGASVLAVLVCLTLLLEPHFEMTLRAGGGGGEGGGAGVKGIQLQLRGSTGSASFVRKPLTPGPGERRLRANPLHQPLPDSRPRSAPSARSNSSDSLSPNVLRGGLPPVNQSLARMAPNLTSQFVLAPSQRTARWPHNPCSPNTFPKRPPDDLRESFEWQKVSQEATNTYVFSAHYDPRSNRKAVVIVGISNDYMSASVPYSCQIWFAKSEAAEVAAAGITTHSETHGRKYASTFYTCTIQSNDSHPFAVSLVTSESRCRSPSNILRISPYDPSNGPEVNFTVCVTPLNYDFDFRQLVEMVELNRMFGAQRVVFYNFTSGSHVTTYLRSYAEDGVVVVVPWKLPVLTDAIGSKTDPEIHYFGQLAALNECLYRNMFRSRFVVLTDLDEIVVPRQHGTWTEMIESLGRGRSSNWQSGVASFHIRNAFFRTDYEQDDLYSGDATVRGLRLRSLLTTTREETTLPHGWRSKHMVKPEAVLFVGIHHIERILDYGRFSIQDVGENMALLHHYRSWAETETSRQPSRTDRYMHCFNETILSRVAAVYQTVAARFKGVATLEELTRNRTESTTL